MKRKVTVHNNDFRGNWGKITITAADEAGRLLSYPAFKVWLRFMQDRDGTTLSERDIDIDVFRELIHVGYIYQGDNPDEWIFDVLRSKGTSKTESAVPESWHNVAEYYGASDDDYYHVLRILSRNGIHNLDEFFRYWLKNIDTVRQLSNRGDPHYPTSWDCGVLATWWKGAQNHSPAMMP